MWRTMVTVVLLACGDKGDSTDDQDPGDDPVDCDASEVPYDGIDQDCSGADLMDVDLDGYDALEAGGDDCDDAAPDVHPTAADVPYDGLDQDCSGADRTDVDTDGYDALDVGGDDCDDDDPAVYPGAPDGLGDGIDQDCSGVDGTDLDGDGWESAAPGGQGHDCDDADPTIFPDAVDTPFDGIDTDCRANCDYDADHDGAVPAEWVGSITDGDPCDRDGSMNIRVDEDCDDTNPDASTQHIDAVTPLDGAVGVAAQVEMSVRLADEEYDARARLLDGNGDPVYIRDDNTGFDIYISRINEVSNYSGYPLDAYTTYTIEVTHSCGVETTTFTTGDGLAPVDPYALVGVVWGATPTGIQTSGFSVLNYVGYNGTIVLVGVTGTDGTTLDLVTAATDNTGVQDLCVPTGEALNVPFDGNPALIAAGPIDVPVRFVDFVANRFPVIHQDGQIETTFIGPNMLELWVSGLVNVESITVPAGMGANAICNQWGGCEVCPDGSGQTCLYEELWMNGSLVFPVNQTIVFRSADDIAADPNCP